MKLARKITKVFLIILALLFVIITIIDGYVVDKYQNKILKEEELKNIEDYKIVVLGASVTSNGVSNMLKDRLDKSIEIYSKKPTKILVTGDGEKEDYNEIEKMVEYLKENEIPYIDIVYDNYGLSTYDSLYRVKEKYKYDKIIIITQKYHLYRSLYIANELGIEAYGIPSSNITYQKQWFRDIREIFARLKDYYKVKIKAQAKYK